MASFYLTLLATTCIATAVTMPVFAQTASQPGTLPPLPVEAKKAPAKAAKKAAPKQAPAPVATPATAPAPTPSLAPETATGPVRDYVATQSATGTKTDTPIREIPQSISVVGAEQIRDQGAQSLQETLRYLPGLVPDGFGFDSRGDYVLLRGLPAAYFLDGLRTTFGYYANTAAIEPYGLERVEVLRGPSSMLYGQASSGGIINAISKRPQMTPHAEIGVDYGSYDWRQVKFDVGGPITTDSRWLYRFVGLMRESGTQVDHVDNDRIFLAPSLTFRPSADTNITLMGTWRKDQGGSVQQFLPHEGTLYPNSVTGRRISKSTFIGEPTDYNDTDQQSVSLLIDHKFTDWLSVGHASRFTHTENTYSTHYTAPLTAGLINAINGTFGFPVYDPANAPFLDPAKQNIARVYLWRNTETDVFNSDTHLTAKFLTGEVAHKVTGGFDYMRYETGGAGTPILVDNLVPFPYGPFPAQTPFNIYNPTYGNNAWYLNFGTGLPEPADGFTVAARADETQVQRGLYIQDQIKLGNWTAVLGLRKDWLTIDYSANPKREESEVTGRAGLMYSFDFGLTPYISYSQSFSAQPGETVLVAPGTFAAAAPLKGEQFEVGFKYQVPGRPLVFNAAYFDLKESNRLVSDILSQTSLQGAEAHIRGFEFDAAGRITENIKVLGGYTYMDAKYSDHFDPVEIGTPVEGVPRHMAYLWGIYSFTEGTFKGLSFGGGVRYIGDSKDYGTLVTGVDGMVKTPGFTLFDAIIAYERDGWRWQLVAQNLEDKFHVVTCTTRGDCGIGQGRTIITSLSYKF
jgi:iron complex outermembrane receptor protein